MKPLTFIYTWLASNFQLSCTWPYNERTNNTTTYADDGNANCGSGQVEHYYYVHLLLQSKNLVMRLNKISMYCFCSLFDEFGCRHAGDGISEDDGRADHM